MDALLFTNESRGELVRSETPAGVAFVPHPLPINWELPTRLSSLVIEARAGLGTLNGVGQTLDSPTLLLRPLQSREAITSSQIEGTIVTPEQQLLFELDPQGTASHEAANFAALADWNEVFNYDRALQQGVITLQTTNTLSNHLIRSLHATLMSGVRGADKSPGAYRTSGVQIGTKARFVPPPGTEVARLMDDLVTYMAAPSTTDPLVRCFLAHFQFETIHPFLDGNGRVGRLLLALMISHTLKHAQPWLYLSAYFDQYNDEYVQHMFRVSTQGDFASWVEYCLLGAVQQSQDAITRCQAFRQLQREFLQRAQPKANSRTYPLIQSLFLHPMTTATQIASQLTVSFPTAKADLERLVEVGILETREHRRTTVYVAREIMRVAYDQYVSNRSEPQDHQAAPPSSGS